LLFVPIELRLRYLAAAALAVLLLVNGSHSARASAPTGGPPAIRVLQQTHRITYGQEIRVTLQAESDAAEITAITARYRPRGPGRISVYAYPAFTPGRSVTASFVIKTGDAAYFPPGTDFDIHFELADSAGNVLETAPQPVEYLDPRYKWKHVTRGALTAVYYNVADDQAGRLLDAAAARLPELARMTGAPDGANFKAVLYRTVSEATSSFPRVSETATDRQFFAGFAQPEYGLLVLGSPDTGSVLHELTHLLMDAAVTSPLAAPVPAWLNEGLAVWAEGAGIESLNSRIRSEASSGRLLRVRSMGTIPGTGPGLSLFYPQAGAFVGYLHGRFGPDGLAAVLRRINDGRRVHDAAQDAWGVSLDDVENEWRQSLGAGPLPTPSPTPRPTATPAGAAAAPLATPAPPDDTRPTPAPVATAAPPPLPVESQTAASAQTALYIALAVIAGAAALAVILRARRRQPGR
jgi:hypothetical protein